MWSGQGQASPPPTHSSPKLSRDSHGNEGIHLPTHTHSGPSWPHNGPSEWPHHLLDFPREGRELTKRRSQAPSPHLLQTLILGINQPEPAVLGSASSHPPPHCISSSANGSDAVHVSNSVWQARLPMSRPWQASKGILQDKWRMVQG